jgi:hypothetical protein
MLWRSYRKKYGSLFFGRRLEQSFGNWMAHYSRFKVKEGTDIDVFDFMPHEEAPSTSFEQERMKAIEKKSA